MSDTSCPTQRRRNGRERSAPVSTARLRRAGTLRTVSSRSMDAAPAISADAWNPQQYEQFRVERQQPFWDLLRLVGVQPVRRAVDLGCGTGMLTLQLHRELHAGETVGVDASPAMLQRAHEISEPGLRFVHADIREIAAGERFDVVFSNAALQWVDDHASLFPRLKAMLTPGGELAVQVPANFDHPSHTLAAEVALEPLFAEATGGYTRESPVLAPEAYAELLHQLGFVEQHVRLQVYGHVLEST